MLVTNFFRSACIDWFLNREFHQKVLIYVYLQFKSEFNENELASTSLHLPLTDDGAVFNILSCCCGVVQKVTVVSLKPRAPELCLFVARDASRMGNFNIPFGKTQSVYRCFPLT